MAAMMKTSVLLAGVMTLGLGGCWEGSLSAERPKDKQVDLAISQLWADEIRRVARDGDWILSRSYSWEGDMITTIQSNWKFSHATMVDVTHGTVIEAITPVVREISIEELMQRNIYVVVVRPTMSAEESSASLERARSQLGAAFDMYGLFGYPTEGKWYCSELMYWASGFQDRNGPQALLVPNELMDYGELVYFSGWRDSPQVQAIAAGRVNIGHDTAVAGAATSATDEALQPSP